MPLILNIFNPDYQFVWIFGSVFAILTLVYFIRKYFRVMPAVWVVIKLALDYYYIILIPIPVLYLFYYYFFFKKTDPNTFIFRNSQLIDDFKTLSFLFFGTGVFSAASKLLSNLVIFKKQFKSIVMSKEFDNLLSEKMEILAYSHETLNRQSNLDEIWKRVTLCKYEKSFPNLMPKLHKNLENELFEQNNLSYYYKNLRVQVNFKLLENDIIHIEEISNCTVVANTEDPIEIHFYLKSAIEDTDEQYVKIDESKTKVDGLILPEDTFSNIEAVLEGVFYKKTYTHTLRGKMEYHIERCIVLKQSLHSDRIYSFASSKIIDDIYLHLQPDNNLNLAFSPVGKNKFVHDNIKLDGISYVNKDLMMPGEKFKVFIYKK